MLNQTQSEIVNSTEKKIVVVAAAASGKTTILVERLRKIINDGVNPKKIVAITFTNNAAANIKERIGDSCKDVFIGTVHSYANYLLLSHGIGTADLLEKEQFNQLFERIKDHPECIIPVEHLLLDESQDTSDIQFEFFDMIKPDNFFYVGDWRQSIYRWANARPEVLIEITQRPGVKTYYMNQNYRNDYNILDFAKNIIRPNGMIYNDRSECMTGNRGRVLTPEFSPSALIEGMKKQNQPWGSWFILCRTNDEVDTMCYQLKQANIPCDTFKKSQLTNDELNKKMKEDTVKVLTIHAAKGLEADNVIVIGQRFFDTEERCVSYVAATRARHLLVWTKPKPRHHDRGGTWNWEK